MTLDKTLSELHEKLADKLLQKVKSGDVTAAELNVARQFLKDNNIDAIPKEGSPLQQLTDSLPFTGDEDTARH
ncbi:MULTISPECIES: hypothetical protein [Agrobacterium]|uniref:Uncharacterized protein n=1 Tax=Agrobacterium pusense TaxID=648995 RepID=A0A6H0ZKK8_9HYPH|nr:MULTISPECIES: hypothetical protein [Agrobacterium]MDH0613323.1 hypothetical protein [Agrobacterium sp. GD03872]MDH0697240.1 hypothetical protein [Agrobacterium sp. GD03871]MDH1062173.1 hypothetical protein [Agrobacterium sp. GD03992]MDH2211347.1 hypothetical protein [Agrobacterium sp. GD03643]MDH2220606.1 hypothetical protein [Agrobacterium sp. GD03638]